MEFNILFEENGHIRNISVSGEIDTKMKSEELLKLLNALGVKEILENPHCFENPFFV